ncbi:MAG: glycoside hydrolase family 57, partial [Anaerolineae bacterium]|nr:glycoside hydrolase family 57 [Anaerolineae bacterium]
MNTHKLLILILLVGLLLTACQPSHTPTPIPTTLPTTEVTSTVPPTPSPEDVIYLSIVWHQHQPLYYKDPETGIYAKPWVRVHATKDYYDMAAMLEEYPDVHVTFNLTPSLIKQLQDFVDGTKDYYWVLAEKPAAELTGEE